MHPDDQERGLGGGGQGAMLPQDQKYGPKYHLLLPPKITQRVSVSSPFRKTRPPFCKLKHLLNDALTAYLG